MLARRSADVFLHAGVAFCCLGNLRFKLDPYCDMGLKLLSEGEVNPFDSMVYSTPRSEARATLRVDTEQRFLPDLKIGASVVSSAERFAAVERINFSEGLACNNEGWHFEAYILWPNKATFQLPV